eukprot:tig00000555_g2149.t1
MADELAAVKEERTKLQSDKDAADSKVANLEQTHKARRSMSIAILWRVGPLTALQATMDELAAVKEERTKLQSDKDAADSKVGDVLAMADALAAVKEERTKLQSDKDAADSKVANLEQTHKARRSMSIAILWRVGPLTTLQATMDELAAVKEERTKLQSDKDAADSKVANLEQTHKARRSMSIAILWRVGPLTALQAMADELAAVKEERTKLQSDKDAADSKVANLEQTHKARRSMSIAILWRVGPLTALQATMDELAAVKEERTKLQSDKDAADSKVGDVLAMADALAAVKEERTKLQSDKDAADSKVANLEQTHKARRSMSIAILWRVGPLTTLQATMDELAAVKEERTKLQSDKDAADSKVANLEQTHKARRSMSIAILWRVGPLTALQATMDELAAVKEERTKLQSDKDAADSKVGDVLISGSKSARRRMHKALSRPAARGLPRLPAMADALAAVKEERTKLQSDKDAADSKVANLEQTHKARRSMSIAILWRVGPLTTLQATMDELAAVKEERTKLQSDKDAADSKVANLEQTHKARRSMSIAILWRVGPLTALQATMDELAAVKEERTKLQSDKDAADSKVANLEQTHKARRSMSIAILWRVGPLTALQATMDELAAVKEERTKLQSDKDAADSKVANLEQTHKARRSMSIAILWRVGPLTTLQATMDELAAVKEERTKLQSDKDAAVKKDSTTDFNDVKQTLAATEAEMRTLLKAKAEAVSQVLPAVIEKACEVIDDKEREAEYVKAPAAAAAASAGEAESALAEAIEALKASSASEAAARTAAAEAAKARSAHGTYVELEADAKKLEAKARTAAAEAAETRAALAEGARARAAASEGSARVAAADAAKSKSEFAEAARAQTAASEAAKREAAAQFAKAQSALDKAAKALKANSDAAARAAEAAINPVAAGDPPPASTAVSRKRSLEDAIGANPPSGSSSSGAPPSSRPRNADDAENVGAGGGGGASPAASCGGGTDPTVPPRQPLGSISHV